MTDNNFTTYTAAFIRMHHLVPHDDADEARMAMLAERAILAGRNIPRVQDKACEPIIDFKAADILLKRGF